MKKMAALLLALPTVACATIPPPDLVIPGKMEQAEADRLYDEYRLACEGTACTQLGDTYDVDAYGKTPFSQARTVLTKNRRNRNLVSWMLFGVGIASGVGAGFSIFERHWEDDPERKTAWTHRAIGTGTGAITAVLAGLLVRALWPEPTETFELTYNRQLKTELAKRVVGDPTAMRAKRPLTDAEKRCIARLSRSIFWFDKLHIKSCMSGRR